VHLNPQSEDALRGVPAQLGCPLVVKAKDTELLWTRPGGRSVSIARDDGELTSQWRNHLVEGRPNCIVQEYIPGGPETVWMVNAYYDATSTALFAASGRKVRQYPAYTGATSFGVCERNVEVIEHTERLVRHVGYRGILDIGWRFDVRDGRYKVLDATRASAPRSGFLPRTAETTWYGLCRLIPLKGRLPWRTCVTAGPGCTSRLIYGPAGTTCTTAS